MLEISKDKALVFQFGLKSPLFYPGKQTTFRSRGILSGAGRVLIFLMKWEADLQFSLLIKKLEKHLQKCGFSPYFPGCLLPGRGLILHRGQQHLLGERTRLLRLPHSLTHCAMGFFFFFFNDHFANFQTGPVFSENVSNPPHDWPGNAPLNPPHLAQPPATAKPRS